MSAARAEALDTAGRVFMALFVVECAAKLVGLGLNGYFADTFNWADLAFAAIGLVELAMVVRGDCARLKAPWKPWQAVPCLP